MIKAFLSLIPLVLFACDETGSPVGTDGVIPSASCYTYASPRDTVSLSVTDLQGNTRGTLRYALAEKDRNTGTFEGEWSGDTLYANYTFQSEGVESVREVAFLRRGDHLIEGYGPVNSEGTAFAAGSKLRFPGQMELTRTDCDN